MNYGFSVCTLVSWVTYIEEIFFIKDRHMPLITAIFEESARSA